MDNQNKLSPPEISYLVVGSKPWNRRVFDEVICHNLGQWYFLDDPQKLNAKYLQSINPRFLFFLHWSWKIPDEIINHYECICFHMTDVPYGRGGSPLQNLIIRGHHQTKLTALRMTSELDGGDVYLKVDLCLEGNAEEIYIRATYVAAQMIQTIIQEQPIPIPQTGEVVLFKRRKPEDSEIPQINSLSELHDFLRMLDAQGYPKAFLNYNGFRYEFSRAALYDGRIMADVTITPLIK
ncbi:Methionyl-tRNA formyltransferase-like protein 2 [Crocosphaera watsonii]|uniref:Methionyl-tRNA formyltransferase-like protein 2 n=1 Tax=Crocosphaera watsonii WH 0401 TaxID=555881 RepID=T2J5R3_CROWT|nr:Methionyl-tRNA formyltransferase-like protein 2 [Crocosphaera watsonii]CCQ59837.1 Methionyl-tRNA formyltransferase-like protein 2 [Crocosphaera watsonii WH 0401]